MKRLFGIALGACALAALVLFTGAPAEAKCGKASASGIGLGPEMAKEMAKMNLAAGLERLAASMVSAESGWRTEP